MDKLLRILALVGMSVWGLPAISAEEELRFAEPVAPARIGADHPTPILIDTDLGTGIDDAFTLGLAVGSEELDTAKTIPRNAPPAATSAKPGVAASIVTVGDDRYAVYDYDDSPVDLSGRDLCLRQRAASQRPVKPPSGSRCGERFRDLRTRVCHP